jgi:amino acid permease
MPFANLVEACSSFPIILVFFLGFAFIKVAKNTKQNKTNVLTNNRKQIGNNSEETKTSALKEKRKEGSQSSPSIEAWQWHPKATK